LRDSTGTAEGFEAIIDRRVVPPYLNVKPVDWMEESEVNWTSTVPVVIIGETGSCPVTVASSAVGTACDPE
jgi:hypothetical protein